MTPNERWLALWTRLGAPAPDAAEAFDRLAARYADPPRHYHTFGHIEKCLAELDHVRGQIADPLPVELALWFHDAVYDTHRQDNEERSADVAEDSMRRLGAADEPLIARVRGAILATKHGGGAADESARWAADIDLKEGLVGESPEDFDRICAAIRKEYAWVPAPFYAKARGELLGKMLAGDAIFHAEHYRAAAEAQARENIRREIGRLG